MTEKLTSTEKIQREAKHLLKFKKDINVYMAFGKGEAGLTGKDFSNWKEEMGFTWEQVALMVGLTYRRCTDLTKDSENLIPLRVTRIIIMATALGLKK